MGGSNRPHPQPLSQPMGEAGRSWLEEEREENFGDGMLRERKMRNAEGRMKNEAGLLAGGVRRLTANLR